MHFITSWQFVQHGCTPFLLILINSLVHITGFYYGKLQVYIDRNKNTCQITSGYFNLRIDEILYLGRNYTLIFWVNFFYNKFDSLKAVRIDLFLFILKVANIRCFILPNVCW